MMYDRVHTDITSLIASMIEVSDELKVTLERWTEKRRGCVADEVCNSVKRRNRLITSIGR